VVLRTLEPGEIADHARHLARYPARASLLRREARRTASRYTWAQVVRLLLTRLEIQARRQALIPGEASRIGAGQRGRRRRALETHWQ
jgi:hypothetical protein